MLLTLCQVASYNFYITCNEGVRVFNPHFSYSSNFSYSPNFILSTNFCMAITSGCWESTDWYMVMLGLLSMSSTWSSARLGLRSLSSAWIMVRGGKVVSFRWLGNFGTEVEGGQVLGSSIVTECLRSLQTERRLQNGHNQ